jgi:hypothetical protein
MLFLKVMLARRLERMDFMNSKLPGRVAGPLLVLLLALGSQSTLAAKPAGKGGGGGSSSEETVASDPPEFFWAAFDHVNRRLRVQGKELITGDAASPVFPQLYVGGELISLSTDEETESVNTMDFTTNVGALLVDFDSLVTALGASGPPPGLLVLEAGDNWEIKVVTATGAAMMSTYFPRTLKELPLDTGSCPCAAEFSAYDKVDALPEATFCSTAEGIDSDEYIEAGYGKSDGSAVIIGSHRSWSSEGLYASSCYARDLSQVVNGEETPQYLGSSPLPVGNQDHLLCVALIESLEPACTP